MVKLNLGAGDDLREGYINCDLFNPKAEVKCDVSKLPYEDNTVDEIFASHIIEHADYYQAREWLKEWKRVLKVGGTLVIETPDLYGSCLKFISLPEERHIEMYGAFFAKAWVPGEVHKFLYTKRELYGQLNNTGFTDITFEEPTMHTHHPNIRSVCKKS